MHEGEGGKDCLLSGVIIYGLRNARLPPSSPL